MNPFTESTVARPLAKNHADRRWSRASRLDMPQPCAGTPRLDAPCTPALPAPDSRAALAHGDTKADQGATTRVARSRMRSKSSRTALALGLCLSLSSLSAMLFKPLTLTAGVAIAAMMVPAQAKAIDLNSATIQQLQSLNGIGPKTAAMIVDERTRGGNFSSLSDLSDRVKGIGPKKAATLQAAGLKIAAGAGGAGGADAKVKPPQGRKKGK